VTQIALDISDTATLPCFRLIVEDRTARARERSPFREICLRLFASDFQKRALRGFRLQVHEIHDHTLILANYTGVQFGNEIVERGGLPVVALAVREVYDYLSFNTSSRTE
jgi:hypothetical protein